jgi:hypothetical protein
LKEDEAMEEQEQSQEQIQPLVGQRGPVEEKEKKNFFKKHISLIVNAVLVVAIVVIVLLYNNRIDHMKADEDARTVALLKMADLHRELGDTLPLSGIIEMNYPYRFFLNNIKEGMTPEQVSDKLGKGVVYLSVSPEKKSDKIKYTFKFHEKHTVVIIVPLKDDKVSGKARLE